MGYQTSSYFITKAPQHDWESVGLPHMWKAWFSLSKYNRLYSFEWGSHTKMDIFWSLEAIKLPRRTWSYFLFWSYIKDVTCYVWINKYSFLYKLSSEGILYKKCYETFMTFIINNFDRVSFSIDPTKDVFVQTFWNSFRLSFLTVLKIGSGKGVFV